MATEILAEIRMQVMWNRLIAVVEEQAQTLIRTAFSTTVREAGDLSAGVFDPQGRMLAQAVTGTPGHVNSMAEGVKHFLAKFPIATMAEDDHYITNDPWFTSGHLHDVTVVSPVFRKGKPVALFACTCHQVDIGGRGQGPDGRSVYEEGLFIPIMKLADRGKVSEPLMELIRTNVRTPFEVEGDIMSYITSNESSGRRLVKMMDEYGLADLDELGGFILERSRAATLEELRKLPKGTWRYTLRLDGYERPVELATALTIRDDGVHVDFAGTSPASSYGINVVFNYCLAYTAFGVKCIVAPGIPNNAGSLAPITVSAPEGSILNVPKPWPVAARHIIGQFLPDAVFGCLTQAVPDRVPAEGCSGLWNAQLRGGPTVTDDGANAAPQAYDLVTFNCGGAGARPTLDGLNGTAFPSGVRSTPTEITENVAPVVVWQKQFRRDSGGPGATRGGVGQEIAYEGINGSPFAVFAMYDRVDNPAGGRSGGKHGACGQVSLGSGTRLRAKGVQMIPLNDRLRLDLPGGGGFGDPLKRPAEQVASDVRDGLVSREAARREYGVVLGQDLRVDEAATAALRAGA
jgi:N-methylhydantoinase B